MTERIDIVVSERGSRTVQRGLNDIGRSADGTASKVNNLQRLLVRFGAAAAFTAAVRATIQFETAIAEVSTLVDTTTVSIDELSDAALRQAAAFGSNPTTQAQALYQIISAGADTAAEATDTLTAANRLAVAGVTDVETAAGGLTAVLNAYGDAVDGAADVSNILFVGVRAGRTTIDELSASIGRVTPIAAAAGVSFAEVTAAVAALTAGGLSTNESVTGLRAIIASIIRPSNEASEAASALGLEFSAAALQSQGLEQFLATLIERTGGSTDALAELFPGVEALGPVLAFAGESGQIFSDTLVDMADRADVVDEAFAKINESGGQQISILFSNLQVLALGLISTLLERLVPVLTFVNENFADLVQILGTAAVAFGIFRLAALATSGQLGVLLGIVATVTRQFGLLAGAQVLASGSMAAFGVFARAALQPLIALNVALLANPFIAIATAIALVVTLLVQFADRIALGEGRLATLADLAAVVWEDISVGLNLIAEVASSVFSAIGEFFNTFVPPIAALAEQIFGDVELSIAGVLRVTARVVDSQVGLFRGAFNVIVAIFSNLPRAFASIGQSAVNALIGALESGINAAASGANFLLRAVGLDEIGSVTLPRAASVGFDIGEAVSTSFVAGFGTEAQDAVEGLLDRAEARARANQAIGAAAGGAGGAGANLDDILPPNPLAAANDNGGGGGSGARRTQQDVDILANFIRGLDQEISLIGESERVRERQLELFGLENQLKRELTVTERELLNAKLDTLQADADSTLISERLADIDRENQLLSVGIRERERLSFVLDLESQLRRDLTAAEREQAIAAVAENQALRERTTILDDLRAPQENLLLQQTALQELFADGSITVGEFNREMRALNVELSGLDTSFGGGLTNGIARVIAQIDTLGSSVSDLVVDTFASATDAIVDFAQTGTVNIREFFSSIFEQLLRLASNQLFAQLLGGGGGGGLGGLLGGGGGGIGGLIGGLFGFQTGGSAMVGGSGGADSQVVAFRATPGERVDVTTPQQQAASGGAANVNVQPQNIRIQNVLDPSVFDQFLETEAGERAILNVIEQNPEGVRRIVQDAA